MTVVINIPENVPKAKRLVEFSKACRIIHLVCSQTGVTPAELESPSKPWHIVWPRWIAIALIRQHTSLSLEEIGLLFDRHHSSIHLAISRLEDEIATNTKSARQFHHLESILLSAPSAAPRAHAPV